MIGILTCHKDDCHDWENNLGISGITYGGLKVMDLSSQCHGSNQW